MRNRLIIIFLLASCAGMAQISPGDLTRAHAHLDGISNCVKCHEVGKKVKSEKCLDCHKEIRQLVSANRGYHTSAEVKGKECFSCHNEHHGRNFQIVRFDSTKFDHRNAQFELLGKHAKLSCKACHKPELIRTNNSQKKDGSWLGLGTTCLDCHADYHQQMLSSNCLSCHNYNGFKPVTGFDHSKTKFALRGKHATTECSQCHKVTERNGSRFQKFSGIPFGACTDCHKDVHEGKFGKDCRSCHSEESFRKVAGLGSFNHDKTRFPLVDKHKTVTCKACHKQSLTTKLKFGRCLDCHADYHKGQFVKAGVSPDCKECHTTAGFTSSGFTIERHNQTTFPLAGSHLATPCFSCHKKGTEWIFRDIKKRCADCHENVHQNSIDPKYFGDQACEKCHDESRWNSVRFDHASTNFLLVGKHASLSCAACHYPEDSNGKRIQRFSGLTGGCLDCHTDVHHNQFDISDKNSCSSCHGFEKWKADRFNHANTRFPLDGNHKDLACTKCHKEVMTGTIKYVRYKFNDITCASCHLR